MQNQNPIQNPFPTAPETRYRTKDEWLAFADTCGHPYLAKTIRYLVDHDFVVLQAVDDVDTSLIDYWLSLTPEQRLRYSSRSAHWIEEARLVDP